MKIERFCLNCGKQQTVRDGERVRNAKARKFCNSSCCVSYNNRLRPKKEKVSKPIKEDTYTKGHVISSCCNWNTARSTITKNARRAFWGSGREKRCQVCGYDKTVQVCHIRAVADFPESALISEINALTYLVPLCPNHHWEFDNGQLVL
jgi:hypothetical protein